MHESVDRLNQVLAAIAEAERKAGRPDGTTQLVAVSKTFGPDDIRPLLEAGWRHFGENRVQESQFKWPELKKDYPDIVLHLIGPLQSNKSAEAVALFDVIQTVDRPKIAKTIAAEMKSQVRSPDLYVQVNTGSEEQKAGIDPQGAVQFVEDCRSEFDLEIAGLMAIPPFDENPGPHFALLRKLAEKAGVAGLSMGMSGDFETAIEFGATHVRVGSSIFGERTSGAWRPPES